jgi:hypothetical protein
MIKLQSGHECLPPISKCDLDLLGSDMGLFESLQSITKLHYIFECVTSNSSFENKYLQTISATLTLEVGTWV